jgi:hypothetical protein
MQGENIDLTFLKFTTIIQTIFPPKTLRKEEKMIKEDSLKIGKAISRQTGVEMLVQDGRITNAPAGYSAIFEGRISQGRYCIIFSPNQYLGKIMEYQTTPQQPFNLSELSLAVAIGINGQFDLYPATSGFKMKNNWLVSCEHEANKENAIAICSISGRHILFPEKEEVTNISHSIF